MSRAQQAKDKIEALDSPTLHELEVATHEFPARDLANVALDEALNASSGPGGTPALADVLSEGNDADGNTITGLPEPENDSEAATKKYVDDNAGDGGSLPIMTGDGDPYGVVTPTAIGWLYIDLTNGALYQAVGATNTDWVGIGGSVNTSEGMAGISSYTGNYAALADGSSPNALVQVNQGNVNVQASTAGNAVFLNSGIGAAIAITDDGDPDSPKTRLGFYNETSGVAQQELPATPNAQDIADALVALGLVTQAT